MALKIEKERSGFPWWRVLMAILLLAVAGLMGWYTFRWYMHGEQPPIEVPFFVSANPAIDETPITKEQIQLHQVDATEPRYISIPSLGVVDARIFSAGVNEHGALSDPANLSDVVWYGESSSPGGGGVSLMNGHNGGISRNGIFAQLGTLPVGDIIIIERGDGEIFRYEVQENQSMHLEEVNSSGMKMMMESAESGHEALNIITCDGRWVPRFGQFDRRIMLRAVLVE